MSSTLTVKCYITSLDIEKFEMKSLVLCHVHRGNRKILTDGSEEFPTFVFRASEFRKPLTRLSVPIATES